MDFGEKLKDIRSQRGLSIKKLGADLDINYTYISKLENSISYPSYGFINKVSEYFNIDSDELLLAAGKIPNDIKDILQNNPKEAIKYLRDKFANDAK